mmetsp:Transcript_59192/g.66251  ORF Transcript_59192/g.66251 Transcript_59192/m.66251 type:complete len:303 (+) Transcript_59192:186-1094(+)
MMMIHQFSIAIAVVLLGCSLSAVHVQSFSGYSSLYSSKLRSSSNTMILKQQHQQQQREAGSSLSAASDNKSNSSSSNEQQDGRVLFQQASTACFLTAALWMSPVALEQSISHHFPPLTLMMISSSQAASAKEIMMTAQDRTAQYARSADLFVGGYTVKGTKLSIRPGNIFKAPGPTESFSVAQECICSAQATEHGIFASGANPGNAFLFVATLNNAGTEWTAEQTSVGVKPPYKATMRFGATAGGTHTAIGSTLTSSGETTAFSAEQSAMGCSEGEEGAAACKAVCGKQGLSWEMIRRKCGL